MSESKFYNAPAPFSVLRRPKHKAPHFFVVAGKRDHENMVRVDLWKSGQTIVLRSGVCARWEGTGGQQSQMLGC